MTRIFNRGELKLALLSVIDSLEEGHGYAIMQELQRRVGRDWQPSPGAIYPALLALEQADSIMSTERDGLRVYRLTPAGSRALAAHDAAPSWHDYSQRADDHRQRVTLSTLLQRFETGLPKRAVLDRRQADEIDAILTRARSDITATLDKGANHG